MPADDVSDLRDVVDAINRLCATMKTEPNPERDPSPEPSVEIASEVDLVRPEAVVVSEVETYVAELWSDASSAWVESVEAVREPSPVPVEAEAAVCAPPQIIRVVPTVTSQVEACAESSCTAEVDSERTVTASSENVESVVLESPTQSTNAEAGPSNLFLHVDAKVPADQTLKVESAKTATKYQSSPQIEKVESAVPDRSPSRPEDIRTVVSDPDLLTMSCEPASEMYYTASSEVSLLSDFEMPDRTQESLDGRETLTSGVIAGHVAAMRERFESMTRTNTPCPDLMRSISPSLDVYRNITPSPDHLG